MISLLRNISYSGCGKENLGYWVMGFFLVRVLWAVRIFLGGNSG